VLLPASPYPVRDPSATTATQRVYRAVAP